MSFRWKVLTAKQRGYRQQLEHWSLEAHWVFRNVVWQEECFSQTYELGPDSFHSDFSSKLTTKNYGCKLLLPSFLKQRLESNVSNHHSISFVCLGKNAVVKTLRPRTLRSQFKSPFCHQNFFGWEGCQTCPGKATSGSLGGQRHYENINSNCIMGVMALCCTKF